MQVPRISYSFWSYFGSYDPSTSDPWHGTNCGGIIGAVKDDETCGVGIAYNCNLGGKCITVIMYKSKNIFKDVGMTMQKHRNKMQHIYAGKSSVRRNKEQKGRGLRRVKACQDFLKPC